MGRSERARRAQRERDRQYRQRLDDNRVSWWNRAAIIATVLAAATGFAAALAQLLHLLGLPAH